MRFLATGSMVGPYRIDGMLGRGGMATVYAATHESLGRAAALKLLDPRLATREDFVRRFQREGRMQASLEHPHVVAVYETVEAEEGLFIAMQLVRGPTLATLIAGGALTAARALTLLDQIAGAIDAAHAAGLVHRDIKPRNVLVADGDHAYLADFGLTTLGDETGLTVTGDVLGTVAYLAPEVIRGETATATSDRYAFAALAFECLTGSVLFPRPTQAAQLYAHTTEPAPRISTRRADLPERLDAVFERALAKSPAGRPRSASEIVRAIREALGEELIATLEPPVPLRSPDLDAAGSTAPAAVPIVAAVAPAADPRRPSRRSLGLVAAAILAAGAGGAGLAAVAIGDGEDRRAVDVPAPLPGMTVLGSDLSRPGRTRDCEGTAVRLGSAGCSILQTRLPGGAVVVPRDGVVRRWAVRSASGELQLQVLRPRDDGYFQLNVSRSEFVADAGVHAFETDLAVEAGDVLALHVVSGSGAGVRPAARTATQRWLPRLRGVTEKPDAPVKGLAGELLLRVEYAPGARQRLPNQVNGPAAAALPAGKVVMRRGARPPGGRRLDFRLVEIGDRYALDLLHRARRIARIDIPDWVPSGGEVVTFDPYTNAGDDDVELDLAYQRFDSARRLSHYIVATPREFVFGN